MAFSIEDDEVVLDASKLARRGGGTAGPASGAGSAGGAGRARRSASDPYDFALDEPTAVGRPQDRGAGGGGGGGAASTSSARRGGRGGAAAASAGGTRSNALLERYRQQVTGGRGGGPASMAVPAAVAAPTRQAVGSSARGATAGRPHDESDSSFDISATMSVDEQSGGPGGSPWRRSGTAGSSNLAAARARLEARASGATAPSRVSTAAAAVPTLRSGSESLGRIVTADSLFGGPVAVAATGAGHAAAPPSIAEETSTATDEVADETSTSMPGAQDGGDAPSARERFGRVFDAASLLGGAPAPSAALVAAQPSGGAPTSARAMPQPPITINTAAPPASRFANADSPGIMMLMQALTPSGGARPSSTGAAAPAAAPRPGVLTVAPSVTFTGPPMRHQASAETVDSYSQDQYDEEEELGDGDDGAIGESIAHREGTLAADISTASVLTALNASVTSPITQRKAGPQPSGAAAVTFQATAAPAAVVTVAIPAAPMPAPVSAPAPVARAVIAAAVTSEAADGGAGGYSMDDFESTRGSALHVHTHGAPPSVRPAHGVAVASTETGLRVEPEAAAPARSGERVIRVTTRPSARGVDAAVQTDAAAAHYGPDSSPWGGFRGATPSPLAATAAMGPQYGGGGSYPWASPSYAVPYPPSPWWPSPSTAPPAMAYGGYAYPPPPYAWPPSPWGAPAMPPPPLPPPTALTASLAAISGGRSGVAASPMVTALAAHGAHLGLTSPAAQQAYFRTLLSGASSAGGGTGDAAAPAAAPATAVGSSLPSGSSRMSRASSVDDGGDGGGGGASTSDGAARRAHAMAFASEAHASVGAAKASPPFPIPPSLLAHPSVARALTNYYTAMAASDAAFERQLQQLQASLAISPAPPTPGSAGTAAPAAATAAPGLSTAQLRPPAATSAAAGSSWTPGLAETRALLASQRNAQPVLSLEEARRRVREEAAANGGRVDIGPVLTAVHGTAR